MQPVDPSTFNWPHADNEPISAGYPHLMLCDKVRRLFVGLSTLNRDPDSVKVTADRSSVPSAPAKSALSSRTVVRTIRIICRNSSFYYYCNYLKSLNLWVDHYIQLFFLS